VLKLLLRLAIPNDTVFLGETDEVTAVVVPKIIRIWLAVGETCGPNVYF